MPGELNSLDDIDFGDKLVCISNESNPESLTIGEVYTVSDWIDDVDGVTVMFEEDGGEWYYPLVNFIHKGSEKDTFQRESITDAVNDFVKSVPKRSKDAKK